jgi:hypothetical protein
MSIQVTGNNETIAVSYSQSTIAVSYSQSTTDYTYAEKSPFGITHAYGINEDSFGFNDSPYGFVEHTLKEGTIHVS